MSASPDCTHAWVWIHFCGSYKMAEGISWDALTLCELTHWGRVTHICVSKPGHRWVRWWRVVHWWQAITWTDAGLLVIGALRTGTKFQSKCDSYLSRKGIWKCRLQNGDHFVSASICFNQSRSKGALATLTWVCFHESAITYTVIYYSGIVIFMISNVLSQEYLKCLSVKWFE